jgi:hypothetical protein
MEMEMEMEMKLLSTQEVSPFALLEQTPDVEVL